MSRLSIITGASPAPAKTINRLLKWAVVISCLVYIGVKMQGVSLSPAGMFNHIPYAPLIFFCVLLLMPLNWFMEAIKWKFLVHKHESIGTGESFKAVLTGVTASIFTPNRVGEFSGKIFSLKRTPAATGIVLNIPAGLSQLLVTLLAGISSLLIHPPAVFSSPLFSFTCILLLGILLYFYFNPFHFFYFLRFLPGASSFRDHLVAITVFGRKELAYVLALSVLRYLIFSTQFFLLLYLNGLVIPWTHLYPLVFLTFLLSTIIPTFAFSEIAVRGSMAVLVIGAVSGNEGAILLSSLWLWVINLALPALAGCLFINRLNFFNPVHEPGI